jgi:NADH pyrophosphatase NudC (nudix superfamily)
MKINSIPDSEMLELVLLLLKHASSLTDFEEVIRFRGKDGSKLIPPITGLGPVKQTMPSMVSQDVV